MVLIPAGKFMMGSLESEKDLYDEEIFEKEGIKLEFINTDNYKRISVIESCFDENASNLRF